MKTLRGLYDELVCVQQTAEQSSTSCGEDAVCDTGARAPGPALEHRVRVAAPLLGGRRLGGGRVGGRRRPVRPLRRRLVLAAAAGFRVFGLAAVHDFVLTMPCHSC